MEEYPDFCFSQSQASVYQIIEEYAPELKESIQKRIQEGRWEVTASAWVETDKNMPSAESLLNHIRYTKKYLQESWGIDPQAPVSYTHLLLLNGDAVSRSKRLRVYAACQSRRDHGDDHRCRQKA